MSSMIMANLDSDAMKSRQHTYSSFQLKHISAYGTIVPSVGVAVNVYLKK
jgi:hypothetical protein